MAVGILEMLWQFTGESCPEGDIGSFTDKEIAEAVGWKKRPAVLIGALCAKDSLWLDADETRRLRVHDWPEHAEYEVCRRLLRLKKDFLPVYGVSVRDRRAPGAHVTNNSETVASNGRAEVGDLRASREAKAKALEDVSGEIEKCWDELWKLDPYGTSEHSARLKFNELMNSAVNPESNARGFVKNRKAWLEYCQASEIKPVGTLKFLEGDCFKSPPAVKEKLSKADQFWEKV